MENKFWYVLWSPAQLKKLEFVFKFEDVILWVPSFKYINDCGEEDILPIFPQYFFVNATLEKCNCLEEHIKDYRMGVKILKDDNDKPIPLTEEEVAHLKNIEQNFSADECFQEESFCLGDHVYISYGPFVEVAGEVIDFKFDMLKVIVPMFNRDVKMWFSKQFCQKIHDR